MIDVKSEGVILEKTDLEFESQAVLNPGCIEVGGILHMFYRAVRHGNFSTIGHCQLKDNKVISRSPKPILVPEYDYEQHGLEDPRIVFFENYYYLFYSAFDGHSVRVAYATSSDLINFKKQGIISPQISYDDAVEIFKKTGLKDTYITGKAWCEALGGKGILIWDKDAFIFPKRIKGRIAFVHRILPDIQVAFAKNFEDFTPDYWMNHLNNLKDHVVMEPKFPFEGQKLGGGCPPIETPDGWIFIYHGVVDTADGTIYHAGAALLDLDNPTKVIGRLSEPLFSPEEHWEKVGYINNVVFPSGANVRNGRVYVYYGAADQIIAAKSFVLDDLIKELKK